MSPITGGGGGGATALSALTDVLLTSPAAGDILRYDGVDWVNVASSSDWLAQYLRLAGRTNGQVVGATAHSGGTQYDVAIEGRLLLGDNIASAAFVTGRVLDVRTSAHNNTIQNNYQIDLSGATGGASGFLTAMQILMSGTLAYTSGSFQARGLAFVSAGFLPNGVTCTVSEGIRSQSSMQETSGAGTTGIAAQYGLHAMAAGPSSAASGHTATEYIAVLAETNNRNKNIDNMFAFVARVFAGSPNGTVNRLAAYVSENNWANVPTWPLAYGILLNDTFLGTVTNRYGAWIGSGYAKSVLGHPVTIGATSDPIHGLDSQSHAGLKTTATKVAVYNAGTETIIPCSAAGGAFAVNLPTAVGILGRIYIIKKVDATANAVTVTPNGAETIDGAATVPLTVQWQIVRVVSDGANWLTF